jgi:DNA helicase-4
LDLINLACLAINNNEIETSFKYILVDEFQDISQDRKRLLQAMLSHNEDTKLFAVGDDWQSIYRFAGSGMDIMTRFTENFGVTDQNFLTQNFRSDQGIVNVSSEFI